MSKRKRIKVKRNIHEIEEWARALDKKDTEKEINMSDNKILNNREAMQALLDGKCLQHSEHFYIMMSENGVIMAYEGSSASSYDYDTNFAWKLYEAPKRMVSKTMYQFVVIDVNKQVHLTTTFYESEEELHEEWDDCFKIVKTIEHKIEVEES